MDSYTTTQEFWSQDVADTIYAIAETLSSKYHANGVSLLECATAEAIYIAHFKPLADALTKAESNPRHLNWTTEPPKVSGQYWWKCEQEQPENPQMVRVVMTNEQYNIFFHYSEGPIFHSCDKCQWAGPISAPKEPTL